jgi:hypothetical protein
MAQGQSALEMYSAKNSQWLIGISISGLSRSYTFNESNYSCLSRVNVVTRTAYY